MGALYWIIESVINKTDKGYLHQKEEGLCQSDEHLKQTTADLLNEPQHRGRNHKDKVTLASVTPTRRTLIYSKIN